MALACNFIMSAFNHFGLNSSHDVFSKVRRFSPLHQQHVLHVSWNSTNHDKHTMNTRQPFTSHTSIWTHPLDTKWILPAQAALWPECVVVITDLCCWWWDVVLLFLYTHRCREEEEGLLNLTGTLWTSFEANLTLTRATTQTALYFSSLFVTYSHFLYIWVSQWIVPSEWHRCKASIK